MRSAPPRAAGVGAAYSPRSTVDRPGSTGGITSVSSGVHGTNAPSGADRSSAGVGGVGARPTLRTVTATLSTPGRGVVNFGPYLREIAALGVEDAGGAVSIELEYSPEPEKIVEWVTEAYASTAKLLREAGLRA